MRERLRQDREFRPAIPSLYTRDEAKRIEGLRSCRTCWPNVEGAEASPLRELSAGGLKSHHIGQVLAEKGGSSLGAIEEVLVKRTVSTADQLAVDSVTVRTEPGVHEYQPEQRVYVLNALNPAAATLRDETVRRAVGVVIE